VLLALVAYLDVSGLVFIYLAVCCNIIELSAILYIFETNGGAGIWTNRGTGCRYSG